MFVNIKLQNKSWNWGLPENQNNLTINFTLLAENSGDSFDSDGRAVVSDNEKRVGFKTME